MENPYNHENKKAMDLVETKYPKIWKCGGELTCVFPSKRKRGKPRRSVLVS